jgi:hypothetical protein
MTDTAHESEKIVCMPLRSPHTGRASTKYKYAGAIDRVEGARVVDWKSTGDPSKFTARKGVGYQPDCYAIALRRMGYTITEYEYRVIQTPQIKLSRADYKLADEVNAAVDDGVEGEDGRMTPGDAYEERCYQWIMERPGERIQSIVQPLTEESMRQAEHWLWAVKERIALARKTQSFLTNESACDAFGVVCAFAPLCQAARNGDDVSGIIEEKYSRKGNTHQELGIDGADIITYSSASTFSLCEQKWAWGTELGLELAGAGTNDALYIGSAMHYGLEHLDTLGLDGALALLDKWVEDNPVIGPDASERQQQAVGKARAMIRAAARYWELGGCSADSID